MSPSLRSVLRAALVGAFAATAASPAAAADKVAVGTGGSASDAPFYIAYDKGFFKDEGLDVDLIVLDSGAKVIAPLGTGELDVGSGALSVGFWNALIRGVKFRIVADRGHTEPGYLYQTVFMRKDLIDSGQFKSLKDLKGMRMGFAAQGVTSLSLLNEAKEQGWGDLLFDGTDETIWNKYIGGKVPVTSHFTVQSTIDKDPAKMQAFVTAIWRATQWIKTHTPDQIYDAIEPYVGSTSRSANILEITALQKVVDYNATIDAADFARGEKVWFREMTGIKPLTIADVVSPGFIEAARKAYPA